MTDPTKHPKLPIDYAKKEVIHNHLTGDKITVKIAKSNCGSVDYHMIEGVGKNAANFVVQNHFVEGSEPKIVQQVEYQKQRVITQTPSYRAHDSNPGCSIFVFLFWSILIGSVFGSFQAVVIFWVIVAVAKIFTP